MVTQPGPHPSADPAGPAAPVQEPAPHAPASEPEPTRLDPPLDDCVAASPLKRLLAAIVDGVVLGILELPLTIAVVLLILNGEATTTVLVLVGIGVALPLAFVILTVCLQGLKGFTLGKLALGLRTTRQGEGGPIGVLRALGRAVLLGICTPLFGLSIFLDPTKRLRGLHDRAVGSVVADIRAGRDPMGPRPDGFERESADHYLGAPSVAVGAPENLMASPGAVWSAPEAPSAPSAADGTDVPAAAPAPGAAEALGWGASAPSAPASQPVPSEAPAPIQSTPWSAAPAPAPAPAPMPSPAPSSDQAPGPVSASAQDPAVSWAPPPPSPAAAPVAPPAPVPPAPPVQQAPAAPPAPPVQQAPSAPPSAPVQSAPAPAVGAAPAAPQGAAPTPQPSWIADEIDESTRLSVPEEEPEDLEQTRVSSLPPRRVRSLRITADDGTTRVLDSAAIIGRNPSGEDGETLIVLRDGTRSVSKTHLRIDGTGEDLVVTDLGSTNGSAIVHADGSREELEANAPTTVPGAPATATIAIGDRLLTLEREQ
ncbi:RDD family protein [Brachybacterium sp. DNPG3]